jgi:prepilin-type N-terminal cleavage/methylation domain-containing protein
MKTTKNNKGFTLVEIILVIVLIGILGTIIIPKFAGQTDKAVIAATKANIESLRSAVRLYQSNNDGALPADLNSLVATYLSEVPEETITPSATVKTTNDGSGGWVYDSGTGDVSVNLAGTDASGDDYSGY